MNWGCPTYSYLLGRLHKESSYPNHNHNPYETILNKVLRLKGSLMQSLNLV